LRQIFQAGPPAARGVNRRAITFSVSEAGAIDLIPRYDDIHASASISSISRCAENSVTMGTLP
jgi:hypothetical protein